MGENVDPIEAELEKLDAEETTPPSNKVRRLLPIILAVVTLGGFAAVVWYAYNTGIREGSEFAAPVLKPDGPSKVAPKNPGGQQIADQDKLVYGKIDKSTAERRVERLLPPPEKPLPAPIARKPAPPPLPAPKLDVPKTPPTSALPTPQPDADKPSAPSKPAPKAAPVAKVSPAAGTPKPAAPKSVPAPPKPKVPEAKKAPVVTAAKPPAAAPKPNLAKSYRVQIGSLRTEAAAKTAWDKRRKENSALLGGLSLLVNRADLGRKGIYYRVQAGPLKDLAEAKRVCDALKKKKVACLVIRP